MAHIATPEFLAELKRRCPAHWYPVAAISFCASNCPDAVPPILQQVLDDLAHAPHDVRIAAARKIRDALFKSSMICGAPRVINALISLHDATPHALRDTETLRNPDPSIEELAQAGKAYFDHTYGNTANATRELLSAIYPDLGYHVAHFAYGYVYAFMGATSPMETSFAMIAALIAIDSPRQIEWHLTGAIRNGATKEEVRAVRDVAMRVAAAAGVVWKDPVPDI